MLSTTPEALEVIRGMISGIAAADSEDALENYPWNASREVQAAWKDEFVQRQIKRRDNVLQTLGAMLGLGGEVVATDYNERPGLLGRNDFITYGVCQHRDGSWSVNS